MASNPNPFADLEKDFEAQKKRADKLKASVDELRQVAEEGKASGKNFTYVVAAVGALIFVVLSVIMLADPRARVAYFCMLPCLILAGTWSYYKKQHP